MSGMQISFEQCFPGRRTLLSIILAGLSPLTGAADSDYFAEIPMVLTASRLEQSTLDAPAAVTVIDRDMIDASGFTEVHDLMRLVPGFVVADWPDGSPMVVNHGLGDPFDRRIKVMIDGREINSPFWGDTRWDNLPIRVDDIERVEVVRGPNGAAYGVNAFQGVINIITRPTGTEDGVTAIARFGRNGFRDASVRVNSAPGSRIDWRVTASQRAATNFEPHREQRMGLHSGESMTRNVFNFTATTSPTTQDELRVQLGVSDGVDRRGNPENIEFPPHRQNNRAVYLHAGWRRSLSADSELSLQYYHQEERVRAGWTVPVPLSATEVANIPVNADRDASRDDLELQYSRRLGPTWRMMVGAGVRNDSVTSERYFTSTDSLDAFNAQLFGSVTWQPVEPLKLDLGGTLEKHHYSGTLFSPRIAANYALSADQSLRLASGIAYRAPSMMESSAFETIQYNGQVKSILYRAMFPVDPERVRYVDAGYVAHFRQLGMRFDARVFRESYSRYLDDNSCVNPPLKPDTIYANRVCKILPPPNYNPFRIEQKSFVFLNSSAFEMDGAEFSIDWHKPEWGRVVLSQAFIDIKPRGKLSDQDIARSAPSAMTSLLLIKDLPGRWRASLGYYHNGEMYWMNGGDRVPARDRFDVKLAHRFGAGESNELSFTVQSAGGAYPDFHAGKYRHEPQAFVGLRLGW